MNNRKSTLEQWMDTAVAPAERLVKFEAWLGRELETRLRWPGEAGRRARMARQARGIVMQFVLALQHRGWLFDGKHLAKHITSRLDSIRKAQDAGQVQNLWPYLKRTFDSYVGERAEELKAEAMSLRCHVSNIEGRISESLPELVAMDQSRLAAEKAKVAARLREKKLSDENQIQLFK